MNISISFSGIITICTLFHRLNGNIASTVISLFEMPIKKIINFARLFYSMIVLRKSSFFKSTSLANILYATIFSSQDKTSITSIDLESRSELVITENCLPLTLVLIVDLQHKCLQ